MSNQLRLFEILENNKKRGVTFGLVNEAIENVVPKFPTLMGKSNSLFLQEQFPEKYWPQALNIRYHKLFNYLIFLAWMRKLVYKKVIENETGQEQTFWNDIKWKDWSKLAKDNKVALQADAKAKAAATKAFPAGYPIDLEDAKKKLAVYYGALNPEQIDAIKSVIDQINNNYIKNSYESFMNLRVGKDLPRTFQARAYIADLAKELEGAYGSADGYDLNNPRRIEVYVGEDEKEPRYVTDSFVFPTFERLKAQIKKHKIAIASNLVVPKDAAEQDELAKAEKVKSIYKQDEGLNQVSKQLFNIYFNREMRLEKKKKAKDPTHNIKKNLVRERAKNMLFKSLKDYSGENVKETLAGFFPGEDLSNIDLPYQNTEVVKRNDGRMAIQNMMPAHLPKKKTTVREIIDGKVVTREVPNTVIMQTQLHKPVELIIKFDSKDLTMDTMRTNLKSQPLGDKYFDPIIFTRFIKRIDLLKKAADPANKIDSSIVRGVENVLSIYGLKSTSTPQEIVEASKRYFYQTAERQEYYQGGKTSATFSLHPTRMSAEARFLHKGHQKQLFDQRVDILLNKGVLDDSRSRTSTRTIDFIKTFVNDFLQPSATDKKPLKRLFLLRAKDIICNLIELKVLENLGDEDMFVDISDTTTPDWFVDKKAITKVIKSELIRYLRQDFFTGSRRKAQDFILGLDSDSESLSCKVSQRGWTPNMCLFGADVRTIQQAAVTAMNQIVKMQDTADIEEELQQRQSIINARAKVRYELEKFVNPFKILLKLYKTIELKNGLTEQKALNSAGKSLTEFVQQNALLSTNDFITNWYNEFQRLLGILVGSDPNALEALNLPKDFLTRSGSPIGITTMQQKFSKKYDPDGLAARMATEDLDETSMNEMIDMYKRNAYNEPTEKEAAKNNILNRMSENNKKVFLAAIADFDNYINQNINRFNNLTNIQQKFLTYLEPTPTGTFLHFEAAKNGIIKMKKYMNDMYIINILGVYLDNLFGPKKKDYKKTQKKQLIILAKLIYNEVMHRRLKADLLVELPPDLRMALSFLEMHT